MSNAHAFTDRVEIEIDLRGETLHSIDGDQRRWPATHRRAPSPERFLAATVARKEASNALMMNDESARKSRGGTARRGRVADPLVSAELARYEAQKLAFAPLMFQAARALRDSGLLDWTYRAGTDGVLASEASLACQTSLYAAELLLESGYASGLCAYHEGRFTITKMGVYFLKDPLTRVNTEFSHHVCYRGAFHLADALKSGMPAGLRELGKWNTVYEGLSGLSPEVKEAWFAFDHHYSDNVFDTCDRHVFNQPVATLVDIGGNTGRWAEQCLRAHAGLTQTIVDLPGQIAMAAEEQAAWVANGRLRFHACNLLENGSELPAGADVYWMSQFLDCFSESQVVEILSKVRRAMRPDSRVFILETFWNRQRYEASRYCVIATSIYFACIANGNSRMYHSERMRNLLAQAGLSVSEEWHDLGLSHSLLCCRANQTT